MTQYHYRRGISLENALLSGRRLPSRPVLFDGSVKIHGGRQREALKIGRYSIRHDAKSHLKLPSRFRFIRRQSSDALRIDRTQKVSAAPYIQLSILFYLIP